MQQDEKIASVYTEAYVELWENARLDEAADELKQVVSAVQSDELVWRFFQSPVLSPEDKINVLNSVIKPVMVMPGQIARMAGEVEPGPCPPE